MHTQMVHSVIRAKKEFFDRNPSGRILNRFSADIGHMDTTIIKAGVACIDIGLQCMMILITVSFISPVLIVACVVVCGFYCLTGSRWQIPLSRLKQLESVTRSPVYSELNSTIDGIIIIRIYK